MPLPESEPVQVTVMLELVKVAPSAGDVIVIVGGVVSGALGVTVTVIV